MSYSHLNPLTRKPINLPYLRQLHKEGKKITMLTAYDATLAAIADEAGVECLLVGDSLGMVLQGRKSTVSVTMADMLYHTRCVAAGANTAWIIADMPYGSYHESLDQAYRNACALIQAGAHMVKLEGGGWTVPVVNYLTTRAIPVCAHLGLTPQSIHILGGYRIQAKDNDSVEQLKKDAFNLQSAGASLCVLELMPSSAANIVTQSCTDMATIGIGAGNGTAGQVLVSYDMLGMTKGNMPRFVKNFLIGQSSIQSAISAYIHAVKTMDFPNNEIHGY